MNFLFFTILIFSIVLNAILIWYTKKLLQKLSFVYDNIEAMKTLNTPFLEHIKGLNEMEMYYGDPTLQGLLDHAGYITEQYSIFSEIFDELQFGVEETQQEQEEDA